MNAIANYELGANKVDYSEEQNLTTFMYNNYWWFTIYNVNDVMLQSGIENSTDDLTTYYMRSHGNMTPYDKIFRETHFLRNIREMYFEKQGYVQGNNINILDYRRNSSQFYQDEDNLGGDQDKISFKGAINADPVMNDTVGLMILDKKSNKYFKLVIDFDMGAFYPSMKIISNMDPMTLVTKAAFINDEFISGEFNNRSLNIVYVEKDKNGVTRPVDFTGEAINCYAGDNVLYFGFAYLNLMSVEEMYMRIKQKIEAKAGVAA